MPTDFTGVWLNTEIEGNVDEFMEKGMEVAWIQRTFMALAGWGKGKLTHVIEMDDAGKHIRNTMNLPELRVFDNVADGEAHASLRASQARRTAAIGRRQRGARSSS